MPLSIVVRAVINGAEEQLFQLKIIQELQHKYNDFSRLHKELPYFTMEVIYHIRYEMAKTVEDVLARRTRALFLNAKVALEIAPKVATIMAHELKKDASWITLELNAFRAIAQHYLPGKI